MPYHYFTIQFGTGQIGTGANSNGEGQEMAGPDETGALILTVANEAVDVRPLDQAR